MIAKIKTKNNSKYLTKNCKEEVNGFLVPIYNINEGFFPAGCEPKQVYLTVIAPNEKKGPHLHYIRTGCFTCIKGNARFILKSENEYKVYHSGEAHGYQTVLVPAGIPAVLQNLGDEDAFVLNMPYPAWTPTMNDEHCADFSDFNFD